MTATSAAARATPAAGPGAAQARGLADRFFPLVVFLVPCLPRPTIEGPAALLAPLALAALVYGAFVWLVAERPEDGGRRARVTRLAAICAASLGSYAVTLAMAPSAGEIVRFGARASMYAGSLALVHWMGSRRLTATAVLGPLFHGYLLVAALIVVVGTTGVSPFEPPAIARDYGFVLPFQKTAGIPRSFGELALIASAAWAYLLVMSPRLRRPVRVVAWALVPLSVIVCQSRTAYLAFAVVTVSYVVFRRVQWLWVTRAVLAACVAGPLTLSLVLPAVEDQPVAQSFVGEGYLRDNVTERVSLVGTATGMLAEAPLRSLLGFPHAAWDERSAADGDGEPTALHNHFLATLLFLGLTGGGVVLVALYLVPMATVLRRGLRTDESLLVVVAMLGAFVSLSFYEGYFSLAFMVLLAALWHEAAPPAGAVQPTGAAR